MDALYQLAGAAKWCLQDRRRAVDEWIVGCDCNGTDGARGASSPLLLFAASVLAPDVFLPSEAERIMSARAETAWLNNWPGPVLEFALRRTDEETLRKNCVGVNELDTAERIWYTDFYLGIRAKADGERSRYMELMRRTTATSPRDATVGRKQFVSRIWGAEFFIARDELLSTR